RVVSVQRRSPGLCPARLGAQQLPKLGALVRVAVVVGVEDLRDRSPARPAGEDRLLAGGRPSPALLSAPVEDRQRVEVRSQLRPCPQRGQLVRAPRPKGRGPGRGCGWFVGYRGVLIAL